MIPVFTTATSKTTDRLAVIFYHEVGAGIGSTTSTHLATVRRSSWRQTLKC